jgi:ferredoxin-NADP reductase
MPKVRIKRTNEIASGTLAVHIEKPDGFSFEAGQFIEAALIDPPETDAEGNSRAFTLASAPYEEELVFATRLRDTAFKRVLKNMPAGRELNLDGPFGSFTLHRDGSRPAVFLAGGIGITPFRSILLEATKGALPHRLFLFYSNRRPEDAAFLEEFQELEKQNSRFTLIATMTDMQHSSRSWADNRGPIDKDMIERRAGPMTSPVHYIIDKDRIEREACPMTSPIYYIAGPPGMVRAMQGMLRTSGVAADSIRAEEFAGY